MANWRPIILSDWNNLRRNMTLLDQLERRLKNNVYNVEKPGKD